MAIRDSFTAEEWAQVTGAPMLASMAVTAADPSGLIGAVQEAAATSRSLLEARGQASLAGEIVATFEDGAERKAMRDRAVEMVRGKQPAEVSAAAIAALGAAAGLVRSKAPEQSAEFNSWLTGLAGRVAEAASEGGFLGVGGEKVSEAEKKSLADIEAALGGIGV